MEYNSTTSIILPCLNEEDSILHCVRQIRATLNCEIIIVDNGSTDNSVSIIKKIQPQFPGLILVHEPRRGYGCAYLKGIEASHGIYLCMADLDGTYDFGFIPAFISKLEEGYGLVVGNRFSKGGNAGMEKDAMPWHHRHIGNPFLSFLVKICFGVKISDIHCGMRAVTRQAIQTISPQTTGMEFASEMIVKAAKRNVRMTEIPISYKKRLGESKLNSFADGWRHLRFILIYCPTALFLLPGAALFGIGCVIMAGLYFASPVFFGLQFYFHPMFLASAMIIVGYQFIFFGGFARIYAATHLGDSDRTLERLFRFITIEKAGLIGIAATLIGLLIYLYIFIEWQRSDFASIDEIKNSIVALTLVVLGMETVSSAFMLSILGIKEK